MKIGFDASILETSEPTGVQRTFSSLLRALSEQNKSHQFLLVSPNPVPTVQGLSDKFSYTVLQRPSYRGLWREFLLPKWIEENRIQIFHSPVSAFPLIAHCKKISTLHEVPWVEPDTKGDDGGKLQHKLWAYFAAQYADAIFCVSNRTAKNLQTLYPASNSKIRVVTHGVDSKFFDSYPKDDSWLTKYQLPKNPFFLCIGKARDKKNLPAAIRAFYLFLERTKARHCLVIAGPPGAALQAAKDLASELRLSDRVFFPGYIHEDDLPRLYSRADALLSLSFSEGFGLTPLEAMACGTPVIASNRGAIPEIVGEAALLIPPNDDGKIAQAMIDLVLHPGLKSEKIALGKKWSAQFRWEDTAKRVLSLYEEIAG